MQKPPAQAATAGHNSRSTQEGFDGLPDLCNRSRQVVHHERGIQPQHHVPERLKTRADQRGSTRSSN